MTARQCLAEDMECNKVIKVIIWSNVQSGVVFSPHMDLNSVATRGGHKCLLQFWPYSIMGYIPVGFAT